MCVSQGNPKEDGDFGPIATSGEASLLSKFYATYHIGGRGHLTTIGVVGDLGRPNRFITD